MSEKAGEEEELSLGFSASRQPKILTCMSLREQKSCTFSRPKTAKANISQYF